MILPFFHTWATFSIFRCVTKGAPLSNIVKHSVTREKFFKSFSFFFA